MVNKPYCPDCGEPMHESTESDAYFHAGAFICVACGYDTDCPPGKVECPDCGYERDEQGYCYHCDMTRQAHEVLYPEDD